jgi:hypothetical protein
MQTISLSKKGVICVDTRAGTSSGTRVTNPNQYDREKPLRNRLLRGQILFHETDARGWRIYPAPLLADD